MNSDPKLSETKPKEKAPDCSGAFSLGEMTEDAIKGRLRGEPLERLKRLPLKYLHR
jgi:hypothetical protein